MKQKEAEVKKILDRVRKNEITAKEAQKLIKALNEEQKENTQSGTWGVLLDKPKTTDNLCLVNVPMEETKEEEEYSVVNENEEDIFDRRLSIKSPLGKEIEGKRKGQVVEVTTGVGTFKYKIIKIGK